MNTPLPSAVPSTNMTLKEDASSSSSASTSSSILKTAAGDVALSVFTSEGTTPASLNSLVALALAQISAASGENANPLQDCAHNLVFLSPETIEVEILISDLLQTLETTDLINTQEESSSLGKQEQRLPQEGCKPQDLAPRSTIDSYGTPKALQQPAVKLAVRYSSAKAPDSRPYTSSSSPQHTSGQFAQRAAQAPGILQHSQTKKDGEQISSQSHNSFIAEKKEQQIFTTKSQESQQDRENRDQKQDRQHDGQHQDDDDDQQKGRGKKYKSKTSAEAVPADLSVAHLRYLNEVRQSREIHVEEEKTFKKKAQSPMALFSAPTPPAGFTPIPTPKIENVFIRFMKLMERILGQAEAEAQELYLRVKERTDNVDTLMLLISKINSEKGAIDWRDDSEMKALVDQAKKLGVTITDTLQWSEEEKKLLKENIQMRKENLEKITQLERTDMQRHLQEVSQCHQARSNALKLLKELMDTFIYNLRP